MKKHLFASSLIIASTFVQAQSADIARSATKDELETVSKQYFDLFGLSVAAATYRENGNIRAFDCPKGTLGYWGKETTPCIGTNDTRRPDSNSSNLSIATLRQGAERLAKSLKFSTYGFKLRVDDLSNLRGSSLNARSVTFTFTEVIQGVDTNGSGRCFDVQLDSRSGKLIAFSAVREARIVGDRVVNINNSKLLCAKAVSKQGGNVLSVSPTWVVVKTIKSLSHLQVGTTRCIALLIAVRTSDGWHYCDPKTGAALHRTSGYK